MKQTAEELKQKGYYTFASYADTFRLYGNNISNSWVKDGDTKVTVDPMIMQWINDSKEWLDAGYLNPTVKVSGMMTGTKQWEVSPKYLHSSSRHGVLISH